MRPPTNPVDRVGEDMRSRERWRRVTLTFAATAGARIVAMAAGLVGTPFAVDYLGPERYGLWVTISSFTALFAFSDLGIGNSLINILAQSNAVSDTEGAGQAVSSAAAILVGVAGVLAVMFAAAYPHIDWRAVFNLSTPAAAADAGPATAVFVGILLVSLPLGLVQRVQLAYQEGFVNGLWVAVGALGGLACLLLAIESHAGLPWVVAGLAGAPVAALSVNGALLFGRRRTSLRPRLSRFNAAIAKQILRAGALFFVLQLAGAGAYETDNIVIAQVLGAKEVTEYAIPFRLFAIAPTLLSFALVALWPAYSEAVARGDVQWIRGALRRSIIIAFAVNIPPTLLLVIFGRPLVHLWVGPTVTPSVGLLLGLASWMVMNSLSGPLAMFLNGVGVVRFQVWCAIAMMVSNIGLSITLAHAIGVSGVVWGSVIAQALFVLAPTALYIPRAMRRISS
jgi:O-antigen/teichoic acid export membrane protein